MRTVRLLICAVTAALLVATWGDTGPAPLAAGEKKDVKDDKKDDKDKKRSGTVVGTLTAKGEAFIEVKADGEEKGRRYVPHWVGGLPAKGGGPDKKMLEVFKKLKIGDRLRLEWEFEERPRAVRVEVLKKADDKK
jgi:hypothetical protein